MTRRILTAACAGLLLATVADARPWPRAATRAECDAACTPEASLFAQVCTPLSRAKAERCQRTGTRSLRRFCRAFGTAVCSGTAPGDTGATLTACQARVDSLTVAYAELVSRYNALALACGQPPLTTTTTTSTTTTTVPASLPGPGGGLGDPCDRLTPCQTGLRCRHPGVCRR